MISEFRGDYFFLSNFYPCEMEYKGMKFHSSEAAFQAQKTNNPYTKEKIANSSAEEAKKLGRRVNLIDGWDDIKIFEMFNIICNKFDQNPDLRDKLLKTKHHILIEGNDWGDKYWGMDLRSGVGDNHLGRILTFVRDNCIDQINGHVTGIRDKEFYISINNIV